MVLVRTKIQIQIFWHSAQCFLLYAQAVYGLIISEEIKNKKEARILCLLVRHSIDEDKCKLCVY